MIELNKSAENFPAKVIAGEDVCHLNHCFVSPLAKEAATEMRALVDLQMLHGLNDQRRDAKIRFHEVAAKLLETSAENISYIPNLATGINMITLGFPFKPGDEVVVYKYDYPSNRDPWLRLETQGVTVKQIEGSVNHNGTPIRWSLEELEQAITSRTKLIALSHVSFVSGFAADLDALGAIAKRSGAKLIIDAAQSMGAQPLYPERVGIDALLSSGWKWLRGPDESAVMYTSPEFRQLLNPVLLGPDMMDRSSYLDHSFKPFSDGRKFEFSTSSGIQQGGLAASIEHSQLAIGIEKIWSEIQELQDSFLSQINPSKAKLVELPARHSSGILALEVSGDPAQLVENLSHEGIRCTTRGGLLRVAIHFWNDQSELRRAADAINKLA